MPIWLQPISACPRVPTLSPYVTQVQIANSGMDSPMAVGGTGGGADSQQSMFDVAWEWNPDTSADFGGARAQADIT